MRARIASNLPQAQAGKTDSESRLSIQFLSHRQLS